MNMLKGSILSLLLLFLGSVSVNAQSQPSYSGSQILIRYDKGTTESEVVEKAGRTVPLDITSVAPEIDKLSAKIGTPLHLAALNSGGWLTIAVNGDEINKNLITFLSQHSSVVSAQVAEGERPGTMPVHVQFKAGTKEAEEAKALKRRGAGTTLKKLSSQIKEELAVPVHIEAGEGGTLVCSIDMATLVQTAVAQLKNLSVIENAQPNYSFGF